MFREMPLMRGWTLTADKLPEQEETPKRGTGFVLPGADSLTAFADLLGFEEEIAARTDEETPSWRLDLPGRIPQGVQGCAVLSREIDFGQMMGDHAALDIGHLCGSGRIQLGEKTLFDFRGGERAQIDLTDALRLGRKQTLSICFDEAQEAGVYGAVTLRTTAYARIEAVELSPDAAKQELHVSVRIRAQREEQYAVRAALAGTLEKEEAPWREVRAKHGLGIREMRFALSMRAPRFEAGKADAPPVLKLSLLYMCREKLGILADARTVMAGYPGETPKTFVPLTKEDCALAPDELIAQVKALHADALYTPVPAPELLKRRAALKGIALISYDPEGLGEFSPCVSAVMQPLVCDVVSPAAACWQLCGMPSMPSVPDPQMFDHELILDAAGHLFDVHAPHTAARMKELRALQIRLRAEAARQRQYAGALCAPGEWRTPEIAAALSAALEPLHLSVLPLRGAWWTHSFFSATVQAFIPEDQRSGAYAAEVELLDEQGMAIALFRRECSVLGGMLGFIEGRLPEHPCVLTLRARLYRSGAAVETQELPVYVGERGPLEAAFL